VLERPYRFKGRATCKNRGGRCADLKFLLITFDFPPSIGGIQTRVYNYVKNLVKSGHDVLLVHLVEPEEWRNYFESSGKEVIVERVHGAEVLRFKYLLKDTLKIFLVVVRRLSGNRPDVVHVFSGINLIVGNLFLAYGLLKRCKVGVSLFGKDYLASRPNPIYFMPLIFSLFLARRIGVNSRATLTLLPEIFKKKARILYPGVDAQELQKAVSVRGADGEERILFVGRLVRRKGPDVLVRAFNLLLKDHPRARLIVVGDGPFAGQLKALVEELGLNDKVEFTGQLRGIQLYSKYAECDVFVMPSRQTSTDMEGFGMVFLEAGFFGKPCIGTRTGGIVEAVLEGETGLLVPQDDEVALRDAIDHVLKDRELARRLGDRARERVSSEFTWERATSRFIAMFC